MRRSKSPASPTGSQPDEDVLFCDLALYVAGSGANSRRAVENVKRVCERQFPGRYRLAIIDIYQQPEEAAAGQILAVPTLVRSKPTPKRLFIGNMATEVDVSGRLRALTEEG